MLDKNSFDLEHQAILAMTSWLCIVLTMGLIGTITLIFCFFVILDCCDCHRVRNRIEEMTFKECFCKEAEWFFQVYTRYN